VPGVVGAGCAAAWIVLRLAASSLSRAMALAGAGSALVLAIAQVRGVDVDLVAWSAMVLVPTAVAVELAAAALLRRRRAERLVVVGTSAQVQGFGHDVRGSSLQVVGSVLTELDLDDESLGDAAGGGPVVVLAQAPDLLRQAAPDTVLYLGSDPALAREVAWLARYHGAAMGVSPLWRVGSSRVRVRGVGARSVVELPWRGEDRDPWWRVGVERLAAAVLLVVLLPVFAAVAIAICSDDRGPVFYRQERTGLGGRRFRLWKFRTMVVQADVLRSALTSANQYDEGTLFKVPGDPRVTRVGRFLRRSSLDELPQLLNVVTGQMRFVGPRPTSAPATTMSPSYRRRTLVRPGITGLWQVSGRSLLTWEEAVDKDLYYLENRSLLLDLRILARTVPAVLSRRGAY
jgi:lipopolysaccharide/colanic/teichoic acid biosynthesis glycosyltransferase